MQDAPLASWQLRELFEATPSEKAIPLGTVTDVPVHSFPDHCVGPLPAWVIFPETLKFPLIVWLPVNVFAAPSWG
jgi:hypothetical protein